MKAIREAVSKKKATMIPPTRAAMRVVDREKAQCEKDVVIHGSDEETAIIISNKPVQQTATAVKPIVFVSMINCVPKSLCSWDFTANGLTSGVATVEYDWFTEQGKIVIGNDVYDIRKHGVFSGHWTYEQNGQLIADAHKPSAMFRTFDIVCCSEGLNLTLKAKSTFTRAFEIVSEQQVIGLISPVHPFTRRATIQCSNAIPERLQLFAFWLVGLTWRRSARNNNNNSGS